MGLSRVRLDSNPQTPILSKVERGRLGKAGGRLEATGLLKRVLRPLDEQNGCAPFGGSDGFGGTARSVEE